MVHLLLYRLHVLVLVPGLPNSHGRLDSPDSHGRLHHCHAYSLGGKFCRFLNTKSVTKNDDNNNLAREDRWIDFGSGRKVKEYFIQILDVDVDSMGEKRYGCHYWPKMDKK